MQAIFAQLFLYLRSVAPENNGMATTQTVALCAQGGSDRVGAAQLKWWKQRGMLIVKQVELYDKPVLEVMPMAASPVATVDDPPLVGTPGHKREFIGACKLLTVSKDAYELGLRLVRMESVTSDALVRALREDGWSVPERYYFGANADIYVDENKLTETPCDGVANTRDAETPLCVNK